MAQSKIRLQTFAHHLSRKYTFPYIVNRITTHCLRLLCPKKKINQRQIIPVCGRTQTLDFQRAIA